MRQFASSCTTFTFLVLAMAAGTGTSFCAAAHRIAGDGVHDDTAGLQALLDAGTSEVRFPVPRVCLLISRTLKIHSGQSLVLSRHTMIRLKAGTGQVMITNSDHENGNVNISLTGGIWDMDNLNQELTAYQKDRRNRGVYTPDLYTGVLMRFNHVKNLTVRGLTLKDPVTFGMQMGDVEQFTIDDITFDYNLQRNNMDGVHVNGRARFGRITNLKGTTNDDLVALNADDGGWAEMTRGPIEDISVDGVYSEDGYRAVRLLSAGSPIRRIQFSNIYGTYRYNVVAFTNHKIHPGAASTFEDVSFRDVFCSKSGANLKFDPAQPGQPNRALIWFETLAVVSNLAISGFHRTENLWAADNILVDPGATIERLQLHDVTVINNSPGPIHILTNRGSIGFLQMSAIYAKAADNAAGGAVVFNEGTIHRSTLQDIFTTNLTPGIAERH